MLFSSCLSIKSTLSDPLYVNDGVILGSNLCMGIAKIVFVFFCITGLTWIVCMNILFYTLPNDTTGLSSSICEDQEIPSTSRDSSFRAIDFIYRMKISGMKFLFCFIS
ncbi:hypothetical protein O6H91_Y293400 [Diphasiastrum complanatum]|nr:hypothetical protein O6H91_Y293400 [Diphasiastrum complanatum]